MPMNTARGVHWAAKGRLRKDLAWLFRAGHRPPKEPWLFARVTIIRHSSQRPDYGNLVESAKPILDILQPYSKRHPQGLGYILDDDPEHLVEEHFWMKAQQLVGWTEVILIQMASIPPRAA